MVCLKIQPLACQSQQMRHCSACISVPFTSHNHSLRKQKKRIHKIWNMSTFTNTTCIVVYSQPTLSEIK